MEMFLIIAFFVLFSCDPVIAVFLKIESTFKIGEIVYLKTDVRQYERLVVRLQIIKGNVMYRVALGPDEGSWHYDFELSREKDIMKLILDTSGDS